jgi:hypothetical protein
MLQGKQIAGFIFCEVDMQISRAFKIAVKLSEIPAWKIAQRAGVNPAILSKIVSGAIGVRRGDTRVLKIAEVLDLRPEECFTDESTMSTRIEHN